MKHWRISWGILAAAGLFAAPAFAQSTFDRQAWLDDFAILKAGLEARYSHLAWAGSRQSGVNTPALDQRTRAWLATAQSDADAEAAIMAFVSGLRDGHLARRPRTEPGEPMHAPETRALVGDAGEGCASLGYAPVTAIGFSLPFESLRSFQLLANGIDQPFRAGVVTSGARRIGIVRIPRFRSAEYLPLCLEAYARLSASGGAVSADDVRGAADGAWLRVLAERLRSLEAAGATAVIVDVAGDGGGNDLGDWAVRLFTDDPVRSAPLFVSDGPAGDVYFEEQLEVYGAALGSRALPGPARRALRRARAFYAAARRAGREARCDMSWVWREQRDWDDVGCRRLQDARYASGFSAYEESGAYRDDALGVLYWPSIADPYRGAWRGPVFVLTDHRTGSAAEMFTALMRDRVGATIVGETTMGLGCGFMGDPEPLTLPHSGMVFSVPNCVRLRANGADEVAGVQPDIPIGPRASEDSRGRAMRLLSAIASP